MATDYECAIGLLAESTRQRHAMMDELTTLRINLADAVAFVRKAGHLPGCAAGSDSCQFSAGEHEMKCGAIEGAWWHNRGHTHFGHDFQPGECSCGHDRIVGSEGGGDG